MKARVSIVIVCLLAVLAVSCTSQPRTNSPTSASNSKEMVVPSGFYVIQPGDTGAKIALKHDLTLADLVAMNPDVQWVKLKVGQLVRIAK